MRDGMVIARTYTSETEARMDGNRLEAMGLDFVVATDNCDGMYPQLDLLSGVHLLVREADAAQVRDLLSPRATALVAHPWDCPACGEHIEAGFDTCWKCGAAYGQ